MDTKQRRRNLLSVLAIGIGFFAGKTIAKTFNVFSNSKSTNVFPSVRIHPNAVSRNTKGQK